MKKGRFLQLLRRLDRSALSSLVGVSLLACAGLGCVFDTSGQAPTEHAASCSATIRGLDGAGTEFALGSSDPEFADRLLATWCLPGPGTAEERVRAEWQGQLADTLVADFRGRPGPWCLVEGSLNCELGEPVDDFETCPAPSSGATLGFCPPPPGPRCVQVDPWLDFLVVDVGVAQLRSMEIANACNEPIDIRAGESIFGPQADEFEVTDNRCAPLPGDSFRTLAPAGSPGDRCELDVTFLPISPSIRLAEYRFVEAPATTVVVQLGGTGLGAGASVVPDALCLNPPSPPDPCSTPGSYVITNLGPGGIRVVDGVLDPDSGTGFEVLTPPTPVAGSFIPRYATATVEVRWCGPLSPGFEEAEYLLTLTTTNAANNTLALTMTTPCP